MRRITFPIVYCEAQTFAVSAAFFQKPGPSERMNVIGYFRKALSESQRKWGPTYMDLLAIISAFRFFRAIIDDNHTTILSDQQPLTNLLNHNKTCDNLDRSVIKL